MFGVVLGRSDTTPFFQGAVPGGTLPPPTTIKLGGVVYPIDLKQYRHSSQETLRDGSVVSAEQNDSLFNANGAWSRYRYTWHQGAGQVNADFRKDSTEFRYRTSVGVDPWTSGQLQLLKTTTLSKALANLMHVSNDKLYVSHGFSPSVLNYTTDLVNWIACTTPGGLIASMCSDGTDLYVAHSAGLVKYANATPTVPTAFATAITGNCTLVAFVGNRLLLGRDNVLYEVAASGTLTPIKTHYQTAFKWTTAFNVGSRIYVGGSSGTRSEIYTLTTDSTLAGALIQGQEAAQLPPGELIRNAAAYSGVVILCTSQGVRQAQVGGDGTLTYGPLLSAFGDTTSVCFEGRFAWVSWTNHPSGYRGVGRIALDQAVDALQPAYASDVYTELNTGLVNAVVRFLGRTVFILTGSGVYAETASTYLTQGTISSGDLYFGTVESKVLTEIQVATTPLVTGQSVYAYVYDDLGTQVAASGITESQASLLTFDMGAEQVRSNEVVLSLRGPGTSTPTIKYWRLRAYPIPPMVLQWVVPLIIYSRVVTGMGEGQELTLEVLTEAQRIRDWYESKDGIIYQEGAAVYRVRLDAFELQPARWNDNGSFFEHTMIVRLVSA